MQKFNGAKNLQFRSAGFSKVRNLNLRISESGFKYCVACTGLNNSYIRISVRLILLLIYSPNFNLHCLHNTSYIIPQAPEWQITTFLSPFHVFITTH